MNNNDRINLTHRISQLAGLTGNTLRYYKTASVPRTRSVQNMRRSANLSTDMLCIKEGLYAEQSAFCGERTHKNIFRHFDNGSRQMPVICREEAIDRLAELIYGTDVTDKIKIYVPSPKNVFESGELKPDMAVAFFATATRHGAIKSKTQTHTTAFYSLDMIISVGYRVNSHRGVQFRIGAPQMLRGLPSKRRIKSATSSRNRRNISFHP